MSSYAGITPRHVNTYHLNNSLLFQFILAEFTEAFTEIQLLDTLCTRTPVTLPVEGTSITDGDIRRQHIEASLTKLVGSTRDYMRLFSWNFSEGRLAKLKSYTALYLQNSESDEKELMALQHYAEKTWQSCVHAIDALHESSNELTPLINALEKASAAMQRFAKQVARLIHHFREDENVIFFILRHHQLFDKLYGGRFVAKVLGRSYPKGLREVENFLVKKYSARGFDNVVPAIHTNIAELEASAAL